MLSLTDNQAFDLCVASYDNSCYSLNRIINLANGLKVRVIGVAVMSKKSGLHALAVTPISDYTMYRITGQLRRVYFVARGTIDYLDYRQDLALADESNKKAVDNKSQFVDYQTFWNSIINIYKPSYFQFTGHSLGGSLAQYASICTKATSKTFAAAKPFNILSDNQKKYCVSDECYFSNRNYSHFDDIVSDLPKKAPRIGLNYVVGENKANADGHPMYQNMGLGGHFLSTFAGQFYNNGKIKIVKKIKRNTEINDSKIPQRLKQTNDYYARLINFLKMSTKKS